MKKPLIALISLLVALLSAEAIHRGWLAQQGEPYSAEETAAELLRRLDPTRGFVPGSPGEQTPRAAVPERRRPILHPYTGSESAHDTGGVLAAFRAGFDPDEYVLVVVGGSVASSWIQASTPLLRGRLEADPRFAGKRMRLLNFAHPSFKQPQQLMRVAYLFSLGYRPDAILNLDGFNEVALSLQNLNDRTHPVYPPPPVWGAIVRGLDALDDATLDETARLWLLHQQAERTVSWTFRLRAHHSSLLGWWATRRMARIDRERFEVYEGRRRAAQAGSRAARAGVDRQRQGPDFDPDPRAVLATGARNWLESSLSLHAMCAARGVYYLHVLQPTLHDSGAKPFSEEERELGPIPTGWDVGARGGYPLLRALVPELEEHGVRFFDASRIFEEVSETLYIDHCHVNQRGNRLLAEAILPAFLEQLPEQ